MFPLSRGSGEDQILLLLLLTVAIQGMIFRGSASFGFQKRAIEGVIDFEDGKVLKIFPYAFDWQRFFGESLISDHMPLAGDPVFVPPGV